MANQYLFNGIERETELDLDWDVAHYRAYDPAIGRWLQIDPKASERESPYVGFANMPNFYIDPLGDTIRYGNYTINNFWRDTYMGRDLTKLGSKVKNFGRNVTNLFNGTSGIVVYGTGKHKGTIELGSDRRVSRVGVLDLGNPENILSTLDLARAGGKDKDALGKFIDQFGDDHPALDFKTEDGYSVFETSVNYTDSNGNSLVYSPFEERESGETATYYRLEVYRDSDKEIVGYGYTEIKQDELKEID